jgi:sterol desaturase/sphingolipid hydroxylase (fatty acid hydroxylase superfamily)
MDFSAIDFLHHRGRLSPLILGLIVAEYLWLRFLTRSKTAGGAGAPYDLKETAATFAIAVGQIAMRGLTALLLQPLFGLAATHRLLEIRMTGILPWMALLVLVDFLYYWFHRCSHQIAWMWASHAVHHSSTRFNLSAAYRLGWTNVLSGGWLFFLLPVLIGFPPLAVFLMLGLDLTYQLFLHTTLIGKLGPLEAVFNTPSHHQVHHAANDGCLDRNFGGILIIFDRLFGTFAAAPSDEALRFGTRGAKPSYNPFVIAFGEWVRLFHRLKQAPSARAALARLVGRPV